MWPEDGAGVLKAAQNVIDPQDEEIKETIFQKNKEKLEIPPMEAAMLCQMRRSVLTSRW